MIVFHHRNPWWKRLARLEVLHYVWAFLIGSINYQCHHMSEWMALGNDNLDFSPKVLVHLIGRLRLHIGVLRPIHPQGHVRARRLVVIPHLVSHLHAASCLPEDEHSALQSASPRSLSAFTYLVTLANLHRHRRHFC